MNHRPAGRESRLMQLVPESQVFIEPRLRGIGPLEGAIWDDWDPVLVGPQSCCPEITGPLLLRH